MISRFDRDPSISPVAYRDFKALHGGMPVVQREPGYRVEQLVILKSRSHTQPVDFSSNAVPTAIMTPAASRFRPDTAREFFRISPARPASQA